MVLPTGRMEGVPKPTNNLLIPPSLYTNQIFIPPVHSTL